ncbi:MAG: hypothetical protein GF398_07385 [Chitinivibrionales bacterium]|nr:hypothetical protein [Chitinivibrionales bacterium]
MSQKDYTPEDVSSLIDFILENKDPAVVGLRKILKNKQTEGRDYPLKQLSMDELSSTRIREKIFDKSERRTIELEQSVIKLQKQIKAQEARLSRAEKEAFERGLNQGRAEGAQTGQEKAANEYAARLEDIQQQIAIMFKNVAQEQQRIFHDSYGLLLKLVCKLTKKILQVEPTLNRDIAPALLKEALAYIADREKLVVHVSTQDLETVSERKDFWLPVGQQLHNAEIVGDDTMQPGDCVIESGSGLVDARLDIQLRELDELIENLWQSMKAASPEKPPEVARDAEESIPPSPQSVEPPPAPVPQEKEKAQEHCARNSDPLPQSDEEGFREVPLDYNEPGNG